LNFSYNLQTEEAGSFETLAATRIPNYTLLFLTATQYFEFFVSSTILIRQGIAISLDIWALNKVRITIIPSLHIVLLLEMLLRLSIVFAVCVRVMLSYDFAIYTQIFD